MTPAAAEDGGRSEQLKATRIFLRPIANPFPLGFVGLAVATLLLAGQELGWIPASEQHQVGLIVLVFAPTLQLIACVFGFLARDPVAATGMGILAVTWGLIGGIDYLSPPHSTSAALATLLFVAASGVLLCAATAAHTKLLPAAVMTVTALRWIATALYEIFNHPVYKTAAGFVGCFLTFLALYAAYALELENLEHKVVLPVGRRRRGRQALQPYLAEQVTEVSAEPGVRNQL